jgi:hypothetical protein
MLPQFQSDAAIFLDISSMAEVQLLTQEGIAGVTEVSIAQVSQLEVKGPKMLLESDLS